MRIITPAALLLALPLASAPAFAQHAKPKECVRFATSWDKAVEEAKLLKLPIVAHIHGFY